MFCDNKSVVESSSRLHAVPHKRHKALSFHCIREALASGVVRFTYIPGDNNPADILSKHWGINHKVWIKLQPLLFWNGNTMDLIEGQ